MGKEARLVRERMIIDAYTNLVSDLTVNEM